MHQIGKCLTCNAIFHFRLNVEFLMANEKIDLLKPLFNNNNNDWILLLLLYHYLLFEARKNCWVLSSCHAAWVNIILDTLKGQCKIGNRQIEPYHTLHTFQFLIIDSFCQNVFLRFVLVIRELKWECGPRVGVSSLNNLAVNLTSDIIYWSSFSN